VVDKLRYYKELNRGIYPIVNADFAINKIFLKLSDSKKTTMKFRLCKNYLLVLSSLIIAVKFSYSLSVDEELTLTQEQKQSLDLVTKLISIIAYTLLFWRSD
jgi:hypothetical protein